MKLVSIYWKYTVYAFLVVLVLGSITHYYIFRNSIHRSTDDVLQEYKQDIQEYAASHDTLLSLHDLELKHSRLLFHEVGKVVKKGKECAIYDSLIYSKYEGEQVIYRVLKFNVDTREGTYQVLLSQPTLEEDDLMSAVVISLSLLLLFFLIAYSWVSTYYTRILWRPFYLLLEQLRRFRIDRQQPDRMPVCGIEEFDEMGNTISDMMGKMHNDYLSLKELTENTSHELQTPLSILKMKLEMLQQQETDNEKVMDLVRDMQHTVSRMTRFNRALLLIARINNDQFANVEQVNLNEYITEYLSAYEDILQDKSVTIVWDSRAPFVVPMNRMLAERLVMNLIVNAVRYNVIGGCLRVETTENSIKIANTYGNIIPSGDLFARFTRSSHDSESTGLGLTIVKSICQKSGLKVEVSVNKVEFCTIVVKNELKSPPF